MATENNLSTLQRVTLSLFLACLIIFILVAGKEFLVPLAWAILISFASIPFLERIQERIRIKWGILTGLYLIFLSVVILGILFFFTYEVAEIIENVPELDKKLLRIENLLLEEISDFGINMFQTLNLNYLTNLLAENSDTIISVIEELGKELANIFLVIIYSFFIIYYKDVLPRFYEIRIKNKEKITEVQQMLVKLIGVVSNYLNGTLLMTLGLGVLIYVFLLLLGVPYAFFFAVFVSVLNLIPYIGNPIGIVVVVSYTMLTKDGFLIPSLTFAALLVANFLQENVLRPLIVGDKLKLNAFMVFFSVIVGGAIWGVAGMILFIPVAGIVKIVLESREETKAYALFFGETNEKSGLKWNLFTRKSPEEMKEFVKKKIKKKEEEENSV